MQLVKRLANWINRLPEGFFVLLVFGGSLAAAFAVPRGRDEGMLPAVVGAAVIAYTGLTWRLVRSAERTRRAAATRESLEARAAMFAARRDFKYGADRSHYRRGWAHIPFQTAGVSLVRQRFIAELDPRAADAVETAAIRMAEYDTLAHYRNTHLETIQGSLDKDTANAHSEAQDACRVAYDWLDRHLKSSNDVV